MAFDPTGITFTPSPAISHVGVDSASGASHNSLSIHNPGSNGIRHWGNSDLSIEDTKITGHVKVGIKAQFGAGLRIHNTLTDGLNNINYGSGDGHQTGVSLGGKTPSDGPRGSADMTRVSITDFTTRNQVFPQELIDSNPNLYHQGDGIAKEPHVFSVPLNPFECIMENFEIDNCTDGGVDAKGPMLMRDGVIQNCKYGIRSWYDNVIILIRVHIDSCYNAAIQLSGGHGQFPSLVATRIFYHDVTFGNNNNVDLQPSKHSSAGSVLPPLSEMWIPLDPMDPLIHEELPHFVHGGSLIAPPPPDYIHGGTVPPIQPPEPPMPNVDPTDAGYVICGQESWTKADGTENFFPVTFDEPMDLAYGQPKDSEFWTGNFAYLTNVPAGEFMFTNEAFGGDPDPGHAKTGFCKVAAVVAPPVEPGLTEDDVNTLIDTKLAAWPRVTVLAD